MRRWLELEATVSPELADPFSSFLFELGSGGIEMEEANQAVTLRAYFPEERIHRQALLRAVQRYLRAVSSKHHQLTVHQMSEENWGESWKQWFSPLAVGERLWIQPPWVSEKPPGRIALVIEPGMAFGTGHHPSTLGCLELIERAVTQGRTNYALDLGTGSGILAIALAKLGVPRVHAVDIDPDALAIARTNALRNEVAAVVQVAESWEASGVAYDCIVANLYRNALEELAHKIHLHLEPLGSFICSGFLVSDEPSICSAYAQLGFTVEQRWERDNWVALWFRKKRP